jgi:hypothetical protein
MYRRFSSNGFKDDDQLTLCNNLPCYMSVSLVTTAHLWTVDGEENFIRRTATNILNKHSQAINKGWSSSLEIRPGSNNTALDLTHPCTHGNESLSSIKCGEFPDWLRNYQLLKRPLLPVVSW